MVNQLFLWAIFNSKLLVYQRVACVSISHFGDFEPPAFGGAPLHSPLKANIAAKKITNSQRLYVYSLMMFDFWWYYNLFMIYLLSWYLSACSRQSRCIWFQQRFFQGWMTFSVLIHLPFSCWSQWGYMWRMTLFFNCDMIGISKMAIDNYRYL